MAENPNSEYEAPSVEEVETEDAPAVTAAGSDSVALSDQRVKRSIRPLESTITEDKMAEEPKSEYEAPSIEEVETEDAPAVTAAGDATGTSDRRLKHALRPLENRIVEDEKAEDPKSKYEAPSIEEVEAEDAPAVTAAGDITGISDRRLKRSIRPLESTIADDEDAAEPKSEYEAPSIEEVETEDAPAVTAAGDETLPPSDRRLKHAVRPVSDTLTQQR